MRAPRCTCPLEKRWRGIYSPARRLRVTRARAPAEAHPNVLLLGLAQRVLPPSRVADNLPADAGMATRKPFPYWLDGGTETCEFCEQLHVLQSQYRCVACDRASCEHCVLVHRETGEVLCLDCAGGGAEKEG